MQKESRRERARQVRRGNWEETSILYLPIGKVSGNGGAKMLKFGRETPILGTCLSGYFMN